MHTCVNTKRSDFSPYMELIDTSIHTLPNNIIPRYARCIYQCLQAALLSQYKYSHFSVFACIFSIKFTKSSICDVCTESPQFLVLNFLKLNFYGSEFSKNTNKSVYLGGTGIHTYLMKPASILLIESQLLLSCNYIN